MSSIVDVYLHGSVHLTNPGSEELFIGILARGFHTAVVAPEGPGGFLGFQMVRSVRSLGSFLRGSEFPGSGVSYSSIKTHTGMSECQALWSTVTDNK